MKKKNKPKQHTLDSMVSCEECGKLVHRKDATVYEPFNEEIYNEKIPKRSCPECAWESNLDV